MPQGYSTAGKSRHHSRQGRAGLRVLGYVGVRSSAVRHPARGLGVLTIGKIGSAQAQQQYYEESVAKSREDYYAGSGEAPGEFFGAGSRARGLSGQTDMENLRRLFAGQDPATGEQLRSMKGNVRVHGFDLTFSAPKSVSILYALGDADLQGNIVAAHEWAAEQAIGYMERDSARVVRGHKASKADLELGIEDTLTTHRAAGFVGIRYRHRVNRLQDPHLHTHYVIGNWAEGPDGRCTALAAEHIYDHAKAGGAVYQLALRSRLRELERWVEWGEVENGLAEVSEELVAPELRKEMSRRSIEIAEADALVAAEKGMRVTRALHAQNWRQTRNPKDMSAHLGQAWSDEIVLRSREWLTPDDVAAYREMPAFESTERFPVAAVQARAFGPNGVTANQNTFERKDIVIEVANAAAQGVGSWLQDIDAAVDAVMASDQVVDVRTEKLREKKTTVELLEHEQRIVEVAVEGLADGRGIVDPETVERGLANFYAGGAGVDALNEDQLGVLHAVAADGNAISSIEALAGSGKTTTAGAMCEVFEAGGYRAFAAGPTGRAVRQLASAGFERPRTLSAWEVKFEIMGPREAIRRTFGAPSRAVLFVDETGMADTRLLSKITTEMADAGVKVVLIGDSYQLTSVRAGGMHAALSRQLGAYKLSEVRRQRNRLEIDALSKLRGGNSTAYLTFKQHTLASYLEETFAGQEVVDEAARAEAAAEFSKGRFAAWADRPDLEVFTGEEANEAAMAQAVGDFMQMREHMLDRAQQAALEGRPTLLAHARGMNSLALVTKDNLRRAALNRMIRERLSEQGVLTGHATMGRFEDQELEWAVGDRVIARRNHKGYDLDNGTLGTIVELDETGMTLADDNGNTRRFDASDPDHVKYVSENLEHAYALTAHGTQGATLEWAGVVGLPGEFSREWAYTALSRAKQTTRVYLVSGHTQAEEERKEYATVMDAELDHEKVIGRLAARMDTRDLEEAALLQRARDGRLELGADDEVDVAAEAELQVDIERYREGRYQLAGEAFHRMQRGEPVGGRRLEAYADLLAHRHTVERTFESEQMQDALQAARDWQRAAEMIEKIHQQAGGDDLDFAQRQSLETLLVAQDEITARYPDPQGILNMETRHAHAVSSLQRETARARAAAVAEHIAAQPGWVTVVGTQPAGRKLRETWREVVEDLAGRYVDARAQPEMDRVRELASDRAADAAVPSTGQASGDRLAAARAQARVSFDALMASPADPALLQAAFDARRVAEQLELDSAPRWLTGTLGERPADPKLAEQWETLGRKMIALRDSHGITSEIDNGYSHADVPLRRAVGRLRIQVGLDQPQPGASLDRGFEIGD
jgi:conjugative relaxase-like TrwC/TraI family protein